VNYEHNGLPFFSLSRVYESLKLGQSGRGGESVQVEVVAFRGSEPSKIAQHVFLLSGPQKVAVDVG
jgi:hypothetical protein